MAPDEPGPARPGRPFAVEVVRSARRRKTVGAQLRDGVLTVRVPGWMSHAEAHRWADEMARRFARRHTAQGVDLAERTAHLARRYGLPAPAAVRWVDMDSRWGSCTPATREVRVSTRVAAFPTWVLDYVVVHELAHLVVADHSAEFWALVGRYPKAERARGYLIAKSGDADDE